MPLSLVASELLAIAGDKTCVQMTHKSLDQSPPFAVFAALALSPLKTPQIGPEICSNNFALGVWDLF